MKIKLLYLREIFKLEKNCLFVKFKLVCDIKIQVCRGAILLPFKMYLEKARKNAKVYTRQTRQTSHFGHSIVLSG